MKKITPLLFTLTTLATLFFSKNSYSFKEKPSTKDVQNYISESALKVLSFQENKGQVRDVNGNSAPYVLFKAQAPNLNIWVTNTGLTYQFLKFEKENIAKELKKMNTSFESIKGDDKKYEWHRIDMVLKGASILKENVVAESEIVNGSINFFNENIPNGVFDVKSYAKITIKNIYQGIDWVLYTNNGLQGSFLKQDFIVHPGADLNNIKLVYEGSGQIDIAGNRILFENELGKMTEGELLVYQGNESNSISSSYVKNKNAKLLQLGAGNNSSLTLNRSFAQSNIENSFSYEVAIQTGAYDKTQDLIIDPQLVWSTFIGVASAYEAIMAMDVDKRTNELYAIGYIGSSDFPMVNLAGAYNQVDSATRDGLILKFTNSGTLLWATYYGGNQSEYLNAVAVDDLGNIFITGNTQSITFPLHNPGGGAYFQSTKSGSLEAVILKFSAAGVRLWATFYGAGLDESGHGVCIDTNNDVIVTGITESQNASSPFPVMASGSQYSQAFGNGSSTGLTCDAFVLKFSNSGVRLWATLYGGNSWDYCYSVATNASNDIIIAGQTWSYNFPLLNPGGGVFYDATMGSSTDGFIVKFTGNGVRQWATLFGGNSTEYSNCVKFDNNGNLLIVGSTGSTTNFPNANPGGGAYYIPNSSGGLDLFILKFNPSGVLTWGTTFGGTNIERFITNDNLVVTSCNDIIISFHTESTDVPTLNFSCITNYYDASANGYGDLFVTKFSALGVFLWGTYVGGDGEDFREALAIDNNDSFFMGGEWTNQGGTDPTSTSYPVVNPLGGAYFDPTWNGGQDDAYLMKFQNLTPNLLQSQTNSGGCNGCNGTATVTVNCGDPSINYVWSTGAQTLNSPSPSNTITGLCPGTYTVTVTSGCNVVLTATFNIGGTFGITPTVTTSGNVTLTCTNPTGSISASAVPIASTYSWAGPGIVSGGSSATVTVGQGGTYTVTATYEGCTATSTVTVIDNKINPNVSTAGSSFEINCYASSDTITVSSTTPGVTYNWSGPGVVSGNTSTTPVVNQPGTYTVIVTNPSNGCTNSATVNVTKDTIAPNLLGGSPLTLNCAVTSAQISASSTTSPVNYNWTGPLGGIVSGATTSTPTVNLPGTYTVIVTNPNNGCTNSATVLVNQNIAIPNVSVGPGFTLTCTVPSGTISSSSSTVGVNYSWSGPSVIGGATSSTATVNAPGTYTVTVTNPVNFCTNTSTVVVNTDNSVPNLTTGPSLTLNCVILSGTISANSTTPNATYNWSAPGGNGIVSGGTTSNPTVNAPGSYTVTVTDPNTGCTTVGSVQVINDITPPTITATSAATITCTTTSDTISVTSTTSGVTYVWSGNGIVSGGTTSSPVINTPGTFTVVVTDPSNGCTSTATVTMAIDTVKPNAVAGNSITLTCVNINDTINVSSSTSPVSYQWSGTGAIVSGSTTSSPIVNIPGTYTVVVTDLSNGCTKTTSVLVNQNIVPPNVTTNGTSTLTCAITSLAINANSTTPNVSYNWSGPAGGIVSGGATASPTIGLTGTYTVVVTDPVNGCTSTSIVTVNNNLTPPNVTAGPSLILHCNLTSSTISASSTTANPQYNWSGPSIVSGQTTSTPTVNQAGTYTVVVTDPINGCTSTATVTVSNAPVPYATVNPSITIILGSSTQLWASGGPGYTWVPSTGLSCTTCDNPMASPLDTTTYCVIVTDQYGCQDSACTTVYVIDPCPPTNKDFLMPNVFTPNGDGLNDLFYVDQWHNECIENLSIEIYDRWGLKMFETTGTNGFWDGRTASGLVTPAGTYFYVVSIQRVRSEPKIYKGFVNVVR